MSEGPPYKNGPVLRQEGVGGGSSLVAEIPQNVRENGPSGLSAQLQEARARVADLERREKLVLEKRGAIQELENRVRSGVGLKGDNTDTEQQILKLEQEIRVLEQSTEKSSGGAYASDRERKGGVFDPTVAERRTELAEAVAQLETYGMVGEEGVRSASVPNPETVAAATPLNARREAVKAAARQDATDYAVRSGRTDLGTNLLHPEYEGKRFNTMNETPEGRERNAGVLAKAVGVDAQREALRQAELRLMQKEGEHYEKGILRRGIRNYFGKSAAERTILEHQMNENALAYEKALSESVKSRLDEKRVMLENQLMDQLKYKPGSEERRGLEKLLKKYTEGTRERNELEMRYRRTVASRDVVERGEKRREAAKKEALASRSYNPAEIAALGTLRYLNDRNKALEKKLGKTGARVVRALGFSFGGSATALLFGPVAATAVVGAAAYNVARTLASTALGGAVAGVTGKVYEKTRGKKAAADLVMQFEGKASTTADIAAKRSAYAEGNAAAIERKRKRVEIVSAIAAGGGLSYGASMAFANPEIAHFIENGVAAAKVDLEAAKTAMGHVLHEINPIGTAYGGGRGFGEVLNGSADHYHNITEVPRGGVADHYHQSPAVMAKLEVGAENGLGYEAMAHHLQEEAAKQGLTAADFPEGSDMHALLAANGTEQSNRVLQELAIRNHFLDPKTLKSALVPKTAHMSFVISGDGKGNILYSQHEFTPAPRPGPGYMSGEPHAGDADPAQHITTGQLTGEPRPGDPDSVGRYATHREVPGEPRPSSPDPVGRIPIHREMSGEPRPNAIEHGEHSFTSGEATTGPTYQSQMPAGEATSGPELHAIFPENPTVPILKGQGYEATIMEWARQAKENGLTQDNFPQGSPAARLLDAVGTKHLSAVADLVAREHNFVYENGLSPIMQQGGNIHVGASGNFEVFDSKMSIHGPFVENAPSGMSATPSLPHGAPSEVLPQPPMPPVEHAVGAPTPEHQDVPIRQTTGPEAGKFTTQFLNQQSLNAARNAVDVPIAPSGTGAHEAVTGAAGAEHLTPQGITADRLNDYISTHPGARGPFTMNPDGSIAEVGAMHTLPNVLRERAPAVTGVQQQNISHSLGGQPLREGVLRGVNGLSVDPKHATLYLTPDNKFVAYGGSSLDRTKAAMKYVYDHPGSTVWLQGDGGVGPNGDPYIVSIHTEIVNGQTLLFPPQPVPGPGEVNKIILPEDLVRPVQ